MGPGDCLSPVHKESADAGKNYTDFAKSQQSAKVCDKQNTGVTAIRPGYNKGLAF